jgi:hypothetical protein
MQMMHPLPERRATWHIINEWARVQPCPGTWSLELGASLKRHKTRMKEKQATTNLPGNAQDSVYSAGPPIPSELFWSLCGNANIPPAFACEVLRLRHARPLSLRGSQAMLFILDCLHNYSSSSVSSQLTYFSPEDVWAVAKNIPPLRLDLLTEALCMGTSAFKLCSFAAQLALTGDCDDIKKVEESKMVHLSTAAPYFNAYGRLWKTQLPLRQTWFRLLGIESKKI